MTLQKLTATLSREILQPKLFEESLNHEMYIKYALQVMFSAKIIFLLLVMLTCEAVVYNHYTQVFTRQL